jgi:hypothetical protein
MRILFQVVFELKKKARKKEIELAHEHQAIAQPVENSTICKN